MADKIYKRTEVYLEQKRMQPKQMFVDLADMLAERRVPSMRQLDVGCAAGEFQEYLLSRFPDAHLTGVDFDTKLVEAAKQHVPGARFYQGDANSMSMLQDASFDAVTMTGTHGIFDDFRQSFGECIRVCKNGGVVVIAGLCNEFPIDMLVYG